MASNRLSSLRLLFSNKQFAMGFTTFMLLVLASIIGRLLIPFDPITMGRFPINLRPSQEHILGTDSLGRDVFAQLLTGTVISLGIGVAASFIGTLIGASVGFTAGYYGGIVDVILRGITDIFIVIPMLPVLVLVGSSVRAIEIWMMVLILTIFAWAWPARQIRGQALSLKEREFIYVAKLSGAKSSKIVFTEIMPHMLSYMGANFIWGVIWAILTEAGLELLGLGPQHTMTLGMMIYWAIFRQAMYNGIWWWWTPPIFLLIFIAVTLYYTYASLDKMINVRLEGRKS